MKGLNVSLILSLVFLLSCKKSVDTISVTALAVSNKAEHNAFTDLIKFDSTYYCIFREGSTHTSYDGKLRILTSKNGKSWNSYALLSLPEKDLRDPHFFIDNHNHLSILTYAIDDKVRFNVIYKLRNDNFIRSEKVDVDNDYWIWSSSKYQDKMYSVGYNTKQFCFNSVFNSSKSKIMLFENTDSACISFGKVEAENWISNKFVCPNESSIVFTSDSTLVTIVRDDNTSKESHIGISKRPYKKWTWKSIPYYVRGPKLAKLPNGKIFLAAASMDQYDKTYYAILNPTDFTIEKIKAFPSSGDTGYPGVIIEGTTALISYYSSHEGNSRVYITRINY
jgi:hypothetical protein